MDSTRMLRIYGIFRGFLFRFMNKEFLIFLFFLATSAGFWLMMVLNETREKDIAIPVSLVDVPGNIVVTDSLPDTVRVTVRDKGYVLLYYTYGNSIQPVKVPFNSYAKGNMKGVVTASDFLKLLSPQLSISSKIVGAKFDKIEFTYNYGLSKKVPVVLDENSTPMAADSYYISDIRFSPRYVTIYASQEKLDSINEVHVVKSDISGLTSTVTRILSIRKIPGVKILPDRVRMTLYTDVLIEKVVDVPITAVGMPEGMILRTFPNTVPVKVTYGQKHTSAITPDMFSVVVNYKDIDQTSEKCRLVLTDTPNGVIGVNLEVQEVDYLIESTK